MHKQIAPIIPISTFDKILAQDIYFLEQASRFGPLEALLFSDQLHIQLFGDKPLYSQKERHYLLGGVKYIQKVKKVENIEELGNYLLNHSEICCLPSHLTKSMHNLKSLLNKKNIKVQTIDTSKAKIEYDDQLSKLTSSNKKVIVTGCYDWFHSGHLRFFEVASQYGDLFVSVGNDKVLTELKGEGHPLFPEKERWYMIQAVKHVHRAFISSGEGWLDAAPEIERIKPDIFVVNHDGDKPEKKQFCADNRIEYVVLARKPKKGLPARSSTDLRGF